jgi:prepilin-type N-terminal cleavage/methylation domain-containing protein
MAERLDRNALALRGNAGFTLIEIMVALIVIGIGALTVGSLFPRATRDIGVSERTTRASEYLQEGMERLSSLGYNDPLLLPAVPHSDPRNPLLGGFEREWTVYADRPIPNCKTIVMEVKWREGGNEQSLGATTVIASVGR